MPYTRRSKSVTMAPESLLRYLVYVIGNSLARGAVF
jgi:hypothetical protein